MRVFIGSSQEAKNVARTIAAALEQIGLEISTEIEVKVWNDVGVFPAGEYTLESLERISQSVDAAIFLFAEDDKTWYRTAEMKSVRDNVLFEYGFFSGVLTKKRVAIVKVGNPKDVSDLAGLTYISYDSTRPNTSREQLKTWICSVENYSTPISNDSIFVTSFQKALSLIIKEASPCDKLSIFAISSSFSVRAFRTEPALNIKEAYILLRKYEGNDPYYSPQMEASILNSVSSWEILKRDNNVENLYLGYFNYHPDEGFYLVDNKLLVLGVLNTSLEDNSSSFEREVIVVRNNSDVGRKIIELYQKRFDFLKENYLNANNEKC